VRIIEEAGPYLHLVPTVLAAPLSTFLWDEYP